MAETSHRPAPRVSPRGRVVGLAALAVALLIAGAGLVSLWIDFNPPELQLLHQATTCTAQGVANGDNCIQTLPARVGVSSRAGVFFSPNASIDLSAGDREGSVVVGVGGDVAIPRQGTTVQVHMWREWIVEVELAGRWYPTSEVPQPLTDNVGVVAFSLIFAVAILYFAVRLLSGRASALDYFS